jgi:ABC-type transport system substrate-binding protein
VIEGIFDRVLHYDYLARPAKLVPLAAEAMPQVSDNGKTWTIKLRKGIYFTDNPAFKGVARELVAEDVAYTFKRFMDPKLRAVWRFLVEGKIVGLDALSEQAKRSGAFDYDARIAGLEVIDRYTIRFRLTETDYNWGYILALPAFGLVAREAIEYYRDDTNAHPVGSGPYMLAEWVRSSKITLAANPKYRGFVWDFAPGDDAIDRQVVAEMKGKSMPQIGVVEISIMEEAQSSWLAFRRGDLDVAGMPASVSRVALRNNKLAPDLVEKGVRLDRTVDPEISYHYFNMQDPVVGGYTKEKIALRRAVWMAYDNAKEIKVLRNGQAIVDEYIIPPGVVGYDRNYRSSVRHDVVGANKLLDKFGYKIGADGYRTLPDGKPFSLRYSSSPDSTSREFDELIKATLDSVHIRMESHKDKFPELLKAERACRLQMRGAAWIADYPDGDDFMQLLYGPNTGESNGACFKLPEYDRLYQKSKLLPDSPERDLLYRQMNRLAEFYAPWGLNNSRYRNMLVQPWVKGYKKHPILVADWMFLDIDQKAKAK